MNFVFSEEQIEIKVGFAGGFGVTLMAFKLFYVYPSLTSFLA